MTQFHILVEGSSDIKALEILIPNIIGNGNQYSLNFHPSRGKSQLLKDLPSLLKAYGKTSGEDPARALTVIMICDLDNQCLKTFRQELLAILDSCDPKPETRFCIAIEEGEAWLLGDMPAIKIAYPGARNEILEIYENDSICGTWELLADAVFAGGSAELRERGWQAAGREKSMWAEEITPHMNVDANASPSFCYFRDKIRALAGMA